MRSQRRVAEVLSRVLPPGANFRILSEEGGGRVLAEVANGRRLELLWIHQGWPHQVRAALQFGPHPDVLMAPAMSPGAQAAAEDAGVGWADERGGASFVVDSIVVAREPRRTAPRDADPRWTPSALAVAEATLTGTRATVADVVERTELADGTVAKALRMFTDEDLLAAVARRGRHSRRWLHHPAGLLDRYAEEAERLRGDLAVTVGVDARDPIAEIVEVGKKWTRDARHWAATGALAAHFQGPYLQAPAPLEVYLDVTSLAGLEGAARDVGLMVVEGGRLTLRPFPSRATAVLASVEYQQTTECWCVPWPRTFADLRTTGVRGEEAAEHLRELHLPPPEQPDD